MLRDYELFHGAVLRSIVVEFGRTVELRIDDSAGRINSFVLNGKLALHLKHSEKRLTPWGFTFTMEQIEELIDLKSKYDELFLGLVCWRDGVVLITSQQFLNIT